MSSKVVAKAKKAPAGAGRTKSAKKTARKNAAGAEGGSRLAVALQRLGSFAKKPLRSATAAQLAKVEKLLGALPDDLRALWAVGGDLDVLGEPDGLSLLSPATATSSARELREFGAPDHVLPIATDHGGNFACFDAQRGRIVDWDHETRKVTALAPSLAALLEKRFVEPLARAAADDAAIAKERATAKTRPAPLAATPKKLSAVPAALITKLDRPGYGGGARSMVFVGENRLALGFQNSIALVKLGDARKDQLWAPGDALAYEPRTGRLLAASFGQVALFDPAKKQLLARFKADIGHGAVAVFSPDGALCAVGDTSGRVNLYDTGKGKGIPKLAAGNERTPSYSLPKGRAAMQLEGSGIVHAIAFRPDGAALAVGSNDGTIRIWDLEERKRATTIRCKAAVQGLDFARDGQALFAALESGRVEVFDARGKPLRAFTTRPAALSLRVLENGFIAVLAKKGAAIHDPATGKRVAKAATRAGWPPRITDVRGSRIATVRPAMVLEVS